MEEIIITLILQAIEAALAEAAEYAIKYIIKKVVDETGRVITQIIYEYDSDGDGINDSEEILYTLNMIIPDLDSGYCLCNNGDELGLGFPQYKLLDGFEIGEYLTTDIITGNDDGFIVDLDNDGDIDDILVPFGFDVTGDGQNDWGWIIDDDDNGFPDASPDAPFYPVGSPEYHSITEGSEGRSSIIVVSGDGTLTVYDMDGTITAEDCDTAYSLWVSENGIMDKQMDNYSVTEGLLFLLVLISVGYFIRGLFKRSVVK